MPNVNPFAEAYSEPYETYKIKRSARKIMATSL